MPVLPKYGLQVVVRVGEREKKKVSECAKVSLAFLLSLLLLLLLPSSRLAPDIKCCVLNHAGVKTGSCTHWIC